MKNNLFLKYGSSISKVLMVLLIMLLVVAIAQAIIAEVSMAFVMRRTCPVRPIEDEITRIKESPKCFMTDGTVHQLLYEENNYHQKDDERKISIYDANDKHIWQGLRKNIPYEYLSWPRQTYSSTFERWRLYGMMTLQPDFSRSIEFPVRQNGEIKIIWRYLPEKEYFIAYDLTGGIAGYICANGFTEQKAEVEGLGKFERFIAWCPKGSNNPVMLWQTDKKVYQIDFQKQIVDTIFQGDKVIESVSFKNWQFTENEDANDIKYRPAVLLETIDGNRHLIMRQPDQIFTFAPPADWNLQEQNITLTATEGNIYLLRSYHGPRLPEEYKYSEKLVEQWIQSIRNKPRDRWEELYIVNETGELNLVNRYEWTIPSYKVEYSGLGFIDKVKFFVTDFSPPVYNILWHGLNKYWPSSIAGSENESIFKLCVVLIRELHARQDILNWSVSFIFVLIALWHGYSRRTNWPTLIMWLVVVALFNLAGFLTYWALNHTQLIKCPVCGKKRHLEQSKCIRCGSDLPLPKSKPTDLIFT
ncbi:MAG: PLDc_N domain-containing protein [Sedimentisphaerales bacterium]|nr:PLDc_N domain-containing protein [Sedimentisphaerales bacterium]